MECWVSWGPAGARTCECDLSWHLGERRVDELLEIHLLVLDIVQRLARAQRGFAEAQRAGRLVAIERLYVQYFEGVGDVVCAQRRPLPVSHELDGLLQHLGKAEVDVAGELFDHVVGE
jgi:hypothetical protein